MMVLEFQKMKSTILYFVCFFHSQKWKGLEVKTFSIDLSFGYTSTPLLK